jgi:hypothetical protein
MIEVTILLGVFLAGVTAGFLLLLRLAAAQEGRHLSAEPPTRVAAAARRLTGLHVQMLPPAAGREDGRP